MWVRGLKLLAAEITDLIIASHPMWVRGLKQYKSEMTSGRCHVAPHVGAWIETPSMVHLLVHFLSHPMWVRGLKLGKLQYISLALCRTPCGCVD